MEISIPGASIGIGGSINGTWYRYITHNKRTSVVDLDNYPGGFCLCQGIRYAIKHGQSGKIQLFLQKLLRNYGE